MFPGNEGGVRQAVDDPPLLRPHSVMLVDVPRTAASADRALGLFTRTDAIVAGRTGDVLARQVRTGAIRRLQRAVYQDAGFPLTSRARARAAMLASATGNVAVSSITAARLWGWSPVEEGPEFLTVPHSCGHRVRRSSPRLHWIRRDLTSAERGEIEGIPVTAPARTLADVLLGATDADAMWIVDQAVRTTPWVADAVRPLLTGRRAALGEHRLAACESRSESPLETIARVLLRSRGFDVVAQFLVRDVLGEPVARADLALPEPMLVIELDGAAPHQEPSALFRDRRRQNSLTALGWTVLRFTWHDVVHRPDQVVAEVGDAVSRLMQRNSA